MKKTIQLNESDLLKIIDKVIKEQSFFEKVKGKLGIKKRQIKIHPSMNPEFKKQIDFSNLSTDSTTPYVCKPNDSNCAQFVNDVSDDLKYIGNAWSAYKVAPGQLVYSAFNNIDSNKVQQAKQMWDLIHKKGGGVEKGPYNKKIASFVNGIVPSKPNVNLQNGDLVGIFYPPSSHHEEAFYQGLTSDKNNSPNSLWGMNTHVGRVMVILDNTPIVFHNVGGNVQATPASLLRIAWVKRKK
jgi:hypothetical protein